MDEIQKKQFKEDCWMAGAVIVAFTIIAGIAILLVNNMK